MTTHEKRHIVITGGGRGLGELLAKRLGGSGTTLYISARSRSAARRTADEVTAAGGAAHAFRCDLGEPESISRFSEDVSSLTSRVDVLINNGAPWLDGHELESRSDSDIIATVTAGAIGTILMTKHFMPLLRRSPVADLVFVVSTAGTPGHVATPAHPAFYAAKHAVTGFAEIMSERLAGTPVRVGAVYPGTFYRNEQNGPQSSLTAESVCDAIVGLLGQPRGGHIKSIVFKD